MSEIMRLQKYMSQSGICSRRKAEEYISQWLVKVNGKVAYIWDSIDAEKDTVEMWDKIIEEQKNLVYYKINKPRGIVTSCAEFWDKNIIDIVDIEERVFPIGRLDKETTGLILLTNDGRLTNYLIHPRYEHEKEYIVEVFWGIDNDALEDMRNGLLILWKYTKQAVIKRISSGKFSIILTEWRNRQIRRMVEKVWHRVKKLKRIRIENIELWKLDLWEYKHLSKKEIENLLEKIWLKNMT
jgi:23S rRNA pseudouridine2605 synthase/23S rRNA pseudouridine2604 synthase